MTSKFAPKGRANEIKRLFCCYDDLCTNRDMVDAKKRFWDRQTDRHTDPQRAAWRCGKQNPLVGGGRIVCQFHKFLKKYSWFKKNNIPRPKIRCNALACNSYTTQLCTAVLVVTVVSWSVNKSSVERFTSWDLSRQSLWFDVTFTSCRSLRKFTK